MSADAEFATEVRRRQFSSLLRHSPQAIFILDTEGCIREWNPATVDLLGWTRAEMLGCPVRQRFPAGEQATFDEVWAHLRLQSEARSVRSEGLHRDGTRVPVEICLAPIQDTDGSFAGVVATLSHHPDPDPDPAGVGPGTDSRSSSTERPGGDNGALTPLQLDDLTGLPGRRWLQRRLTEPIAAGQTRAAAVVDIDAFALVNQDYGPDAADDVLCELAGRLSALCGPSSVGRWQADEFVIVLDGPDAAGLLSAQIDAVLQVARQPFRLPDGPLRLTVSVGLADSTRILPAQLFRAASAAMGAAKNRGRDCAVWFEGDTTPAVGVSGLRMANDLHRGLASGEMRLHFQPILELATNDVVGVEALVRWQRPGVGLLQPGAFIELAERTGQIVALGEWVIRQACEAAVALGRARTAPLRVSINVSARQLNDPGLVETLDRALSATRCAARTIAVEVTETAILHDLGAATTVLEAVGALGVELDLDDFGTGYSSLLYLKHFPASRIKIDRSFVSGLGTDTADTAIVASTIALAHSFGLGAIAEGVETPRQLTLLRQLGCDFAQGHLLCQPLPYDELTAWLEEQVPSRLLSRTSEHASPPSHPPAGGDVARDHAADRRDDAADRRDIAGDRRDIASQAQDDAGDAREFGADERDEAGDIRDRAGDRRDDAADQRDQLADQRDRVANRRDATASSLGEAPPESDRKAEQADLALSAMARQETAADRSQASGDRELGAAERRQAALDRAGAFADRHSGLEGREQSSLDRRRAQADRAVSAHERRAVSYDALTGAHLLDAGLQALQAEVDRAHLSGSLLTVAHVRMTGPGGTDEDGQINEDALMVVLANALGACLRQTDLLIRSGATQFLCVMPGAARDEAIERLDPLHVALAGPPPFGVATLGYASLVGDDSVEGLVARARGEGRPRL